MSKETSIIIKGVAILMMLWYHLFLTEDVSILCFPLIIVNDKPIVSYIANACYPVTFFLILSGYGLTYLYKNNRLNIKDQCKRIFKLYIHYWIVLLIFVTIGFFINPEVYPNSLIHIIINLLGLKCTYNGEIWFILPYTYICLTSYWIIHYIYNLNSKKKIAISLFIYGILFLTARHISHHLPENIVLETIIIQPLYYITLLFYFSLGIILYRLLEVKHKFELIIDNKTVYVLLIIGLFVTKCLFKITLADGLYALAFIWCFLELPIHKYIRKVLLGLGKRSMIMWMTHTFFCVYLFQDFIYSFKYPIIIYIVLVIISYVTALPIMWLAKKIIRLCSL